MLAGAIQDLEEALLPLQPALMRLLDHALAVTSADVRRCAAQVLTSMVVCCTAIGEGHHGGGRGVDNGAGNKNTSSSVERWWDKCATGAPPMQWRAPSAACVACAQQLVTRYVEQPLGLLSQVNAAAVGGPGDAREGLRVLVSCVYYTLRALGDGAAGWEMRDVHGMVWARTRRCIYENSTV